MRLSELIDRLARIRDEQGGEVFVFIAPTFGKMEIRPTTDVGVLFPKSSGTLVVIK